MIVFAAFDVFFGDACADFFFAATAREEAASFFAATFFATAFFATATLARASLDFSAALTLTEEAFADFDDFFAVELLEITTRTAFFDATEDPVRFAACFVFDPFFKDAPRSSTICFCRQPFSTS